MERMESKMQDRYEAVDHWQREAFSDGFKAGMLEAVHTLREGAQAHVIAADESRKVAEIQGHRFAEAVLRSWANGLEMDAEKAPAP